MFIKALYLLFIITRYYSTVNWIAGEYYQDFNP